MQKSISQKEFDKVAQLSHFGWGIVFILVPALYGNFGIVFFAVLISVALAAFKEFYYDQHFESKEVRGSNLRDFLFYCLGIFTGFTMYLIHWVQW